MRFIAALMTAIGQDVTIRLHPALLGPVLGDASPDEVLTTVSVRGEQEQQQGGER